MWKDPFVEELHAMRKERALRLKGDLGKIVEEIREQAAALSTEPRVKLSPRRPERIADAA
ncbi:MAG: hypothetical protein EXR28_14175 [Betaproteobacteria bacterium]|nr:hypothetical protein [Betaproteobacteria bacterium]